MSLRPQDPVMPGYLAQQLLGQMPGFVGVLSGPTHLHEYVNDAYVAIAGPREFLGRTVRDVFPELEEQGFYELLDRVYATGERHVARAMPIRFAGEPEPRLIDFVYEPIRGEDSRVAGIFVGGYDVTETHRAVAALELSEAKLRALDAKLEQEVLERTLARDRTWEVTPDLMGALNSDGYFVTSNPAWKTLLGWTEDEVAGMSIFELLHPEDVERTKAGFALTQIGQPAIQFPNRYRGKDGRYRWISWVGVPEGGMVYCTGRDITKEMETEAERHRLWSLSEDMLARANYDGHMLAVNPAWTKVLGWSEHELLTRPYGEIIDAKSFESVALALDQMRRSGQPTRFENRILTSRGDWKPVGWTVSPEPDGLNFIAVGRDLSEDKARERILAQAQEALRQSQKLEAMGQLTGGVAHDFNNLLTPIIGSLDTLARRALGSERERRLIDGALQSAERAKTLVQRLLAFARRQPLQPVALRLPVLIDGIADLLGSTLGPTILLRIELEEDLPPVEVDAHQLEMAILNLSVNARDAMRSGGALTIAAKRRRVHGNDRSALAPGEYVGLSVADTGVGMDAETLVRSIEPFFSTKGIGQGTGLGLSMVHGLAAQLGGELKLASIVGRGTVAELWLPVGGNPVASHREEGTPASHIEVRGTVLLVDDERLVRQSIADMLNEFGFEVIEANSAERALQILRDGTVVDVLVTDHLMPGMSGTQLAEHARTLKPGLPTLIVSGYADVAAIAQDYPRLVKPFRSAELAVYLRAMKLLGE